MYPPLVNTIHTSFRLPRDKPWYLRTDKGVMHEIHFPGSEQLPLLATEVVSIDSGLGFVDKYPSDESQPPTISVTIPHKNPSWNWTGNLHVPHPRFSTCRTLKAPDQFNPGWKIWTDSHTKKELLRINTSFLHAYDL